MREPARRKLRTLLLGGAWLALEALSSCSLDSRVLRVEASGGADDGAGRSTMGGASSASTGGASAGSAVAESGAGGARGAGGDAGAESAGANAGASSDGSTSVCNNPNICAACGACSAGSLCADAIAACDANTDCRNLSGCLNACSSDDCTERCNALYANGAADFAQALACLICGCLDVCPNPNVDCSH